MNEFVTYRKIITATVSQFKAGVLADADEKTAAASTLAVAGLTTNKCLVQHLLLIHLAHKKLLDISQPPWPHVWS